MFNLIKKSINLFFRQWINKANKKKLINKDPTIIVSNCNGAFIAHDLGLKFNSPFVNLYLTPSDFIKYLSRIHYYQQQEVTFIKLPDINYPVGKLEDLTIHFMHYHSEQDAKQKWKQRSKRINLENCFIIMTDRDGCSEQDLINFDNLDFKNKIVFTHKKVPEIQSALYIEKFKNETQVGDLFEFSGWFGKKYYDQLDYVSWFNQQCKDK